jgi:hypothetical protein
MAAFKDASEMHYILGQLYDEAKRDSRIAPKVRDASLVIRFRYEEPDGVVTFNAAAPPSTEDGFFDVIWGEAPELKPDIEMSMKADIAHQFWHGKINLMTALTRRQIVARGPIPKILKLLPAVEPMYQMYPRLLREMGREDLVLH